MHLDCEVYRIEKTKKQEFKLIQLYNKDGILLFEGESWKSVGVMDEAGGKAVLCLGEVREGYVVVK